MNSTKLNTALIVEDNSEVRKLLNMILSGQGYLVVEARDGFEAHDVLNNYTFDLMTVDLRMPRLDGEDLIEDVSRDPAHDHMKIYVVTALPHRIEDGLLDRVTAVIPKPVDVEQFIRMISATNGEPAVTA